MNLLLGQQFDEFEVVVVPNGCWLCVGFWLCGDGGGYRFFVLFGVFVVLVRVRKVVSSGVMIGVNSCIAMFATTRCEIRLFIVAIVVWMKIILVL